MWAVTERAAGMVECSSQGQKRLCEITARSIKYATFVLWKETKVEII